MGKQDHSAGSGRVVVVQVLHEAHPGVVRMNLLARSYVWWPSINTDVEHKVQHCHQCQVNQNRRAKYLCIQSIGIPQETVVPIACGLRRTVSGETLLIIVDAYSKWLDVHVKDTSTSAATIEKLRITCANQGLPEVLVTDNASCFTSDAFERFSSNNGVKHVTSPAYHPSSNLAEWTVQTFKESMKLNGGSIQARMSRFSFHYRTTPQTVTEHAPAELLNNRKFRSVLDTLRPDGQGTLRYRQLRKQQSESKQQRLLHPRSRVYVQQVGSGGARWLPGTVVSANDSLATVQLDDDRWIRRHLDHVRVKSDSEPSRKRTDTCDEPVDDSDEPVIVPSASVDTPEDDKGQHPSAPPIHAYQQDKTSAKSLGSVDQQSDEQQAVAQTTSTTSVADRQADASPTTTATSGALGYSSSFQSNVRRSTRSIQRRHPVRFNDYVVN